MYTSQTARGLFVVVASITLPLGGLSALVSRGSEWAPVSAARLAEATLGQTGPANDECCVRSERDTCKEPVGCYEPPVFCEPNEAHYGNCERGVCVDGDEGQNCPAPTMRTRAVDVCTLTGQTKACAAPFPEGLETCAYTYIGHDEEDAHQITVEDCTSESTLCLVQPAQTCDAAN